MRLNAAIALDGLSQHETDVDLVIERIRSMLHTVVPDVWVELLSIGTDSLPTPPNLAEVLHEAELMQRDLLHRFWLDRDVRLLLSSLRVAHAIGSMSAARIRAVMDDEA